MLVKTAITSLVENTIVVEGGIVNRRQFMKASMIGGGAALGVGGGTFLLIEEVDKSELTITAALKKLESLPLTELTSSGQWNVSQIFMHCAQSIHYSMSQFPEHKSSFFKNTVGKLAFSAFAAKGKMTHSLSEPIPGAPLLTANTDVNVALNRLKQSFIDFDSFQGPIAPHFAYGKLTKQEFVQAHVMHLNNHLQEISN